MNTFRYIKLIALFIVLAQTAFSMEPPNREKKQHADFLTLREDCADATESIDLEINNVRARLWVGGDIWWDKSNGRYVVPKPPVGSGLDEVSSIFAGGVWLGGFDPNGNLKLAASTYPNGDADYFPGPLDSETGLTDATSCLRWDKFFTVKGDDIRTAVRDFDADPANYDIDMAPDDVKFWPGQGNVFFVQEHNFQLPNQEGGLGAFWDENDDGIYNAGDGDFPVIDIRGCEPTTRKEAVELVPDEMIFWIYNDAGNTHRTSLASPINMEVQVQAFAYSTNDEINDMTFMRYKLINRAKEDIRRTYFAMWVDPDLGCAFDDYIGCDVERSLAYTYNVDALDGQGDGVECGGTPTYEDEIPIIGTDYFRGPVAPKVICDGPEVGCDQHVIKSSDEFNAFANEVGDTIYIRDPILSQGESGDFGFELGMSSFIYSNNCGFSQSAPQTCDPNIGHEFYSYLEGKWLDGTEDPDDNPPLTVGGEGFNPGSSDVTRFAFPDAPSITGGWSMCEEELEAGDRRTVQASGPFLLTPNVVNELIVGAVWVPNLDYPCPDISKLTTADDIAQNLFDNCFDIIDGPDAPTVSTIELDKEIILVLHNDTIESNNAKFQYQELDIRSSEEIPEEERIYRFEGYKVFQLSGPTVSPQELDDIEKARLVVQVDVKNGVTEIYNWTPSSDPNGPRTGNTDFLWTPTLEVTGEDQGIRNTFRLTSDAFAAGDPRLVNHTEYYFMAVAYGWNEYAAFNPNNSLLTQANPYIEGRGNVMTYSAIPRPIVYETLNSMYGDGVQITRISGTGTGGRILDMQDGMHDVILDGSFDGRIEYKEGFGPLDVVVYNPLEVRNARFRLEILGEHRNCEISDGAIWRLTDLDSDFVAVSETTLDQLNEELIPEYGIALNVNQQENAGSATVEGNGALSATVEYESDDATRWYAALQDGLPSLGPDELNNVARRLYEFILTDGEDVTSSSTDPDSDFEDLGDGLWYPFMLTSSVTKQLGPLDLPYITPAWNPVNNNSMENVRPRNPNIIKDLNNVDIVMTNDKDKWSRCMVMETANRFMPGFSGEMLTLKEEPSIGIDGQPDGTGTGMSWFPGYAIDVETGKRLNIFFGENSAFNQEYSDARTEEGDGLSFTRGSDMLYNPSDEFFSDPTAQNFEDVIQNIYLGGQHFIYVTREEYDECEAFVTAYREAFIPALVQARLLKAITWTSMSFMAAGTESLSYSDGIVPSDVTFKLRVEKPYNREVVFNQDDPDRACDQPEGDLGNLPVYEFEIAGKMAEDLLQEEHEGALSNVNVVPNPYFAYSPYERDQFDRTVKITNLPDRAIVTIYSLDGKFITQFNRSETVGRQSGANPSVPNTQTSPALNWNLENSAGIPVASGVYLIHISAPELGEERTIKWFGVNRKFDPSGL